MATTKISEIEIGEKVILNNTDTGDVCVAKLAKNGNTGPNEKPYYMALVGDLRDEDTDGLREVICGQEEADAAGIAL